MVMVRIIQTLEENTMTDRNGNMSDIDLVLVVAVLIAAVVQARVVVAVGRRKGSTRGGDRVSGDSRRVNVVNGLPITISGPRQEAPRG